MLDWNVDTAELETVQSPVDDWGSLTSGKQQKADQTFRTELDDLILRHSDRQEQIRAVAEAFLAYAKVKGPLDDPQDLIVLLRGAGVIEFRIGPSPAQVADADAYRQRLTKRGPKAGKKLPYRWFVVDDITQFAGKEADRKQLEASVEQFFAKQRLIGQRYRDEIYLLLGNTPFDSITDTEAQQGWKLENARYDVDRNMLPAVSFQLNPYGGRLMTDMTRPDDRKGMPMAIVLDDRVITAPSIQDTLARNIIVNRGTGGFSRKDQRYLVNTLNAGTLKARLSTDPISVDHFGPQLGQDNLKRGKDAAIWALAVVAIFMACYYLFNGMVANFALLTNMLLILGTMAQLHATFTLPGIAGIVLTIGMAVDANVLIFERIREELSRKADLRSAIRLGYGKALVTIVDANVTTLITCIILGYTATAEVKGFAVTLGIGIVATLFTSLFCTRVIIDLAVEVAKVRSMPMLPMLVPFVDRLLHPSVNWIGLRRVFLATSIVLIVAGAAAVYGRGVDLLDIEFRAGTKVAFHLKKDRTLTLQEVRDRLDEIGRRGILGADDERIKIPQLTHDEGPSVVTMGDAKIEGTSVSAAAFSVSCLSLDSNLVSQAVKEAFADVLEAELPLTFDGAAQDDVAPPIKQSTDVVVPVLHAILGENIGRPDVRHDVTDFLGGVAIRLDHITPTVTLKDLRDRISRMRLTSRFNDLPVQVFEVIGVELDDVAVSDESHYRSVAVVIAPDEQTNYIENEAHAETFYEDGTGLAATQWQVVHAAMRRDESLQRVSVFSPQVSKTMKTRATVAMLLSLLAVVAYIWLRFGSLRYGLAAIVALVHDVVIAMGLVAVCGTLHDSALGHALGLSDFKVNLALVAAMLTIIGYSLNDTIVIFDRVRENRGRLATATPAIINDSINQTISRTVLTSGTTLLALLTLYLFGGQGVHGFAFAMIIGVFVGTYSSIAIAAPLLLLGHERAGEASGRPEDGV